MDEVVGGAVGLRECARILGVSRHRLEWAISQGRLVVTPGPAGPRIDLGVARAWLAAAPRSGKFWTEAQLAYLREHYPTSPAADVATALGKPVNAVVLKAARLKLVSALRSTSQSVRHDYFSTLSRPMQAYLLGLLAADGNVQEPHRIALALHHKDRALMELARDELAPDKRLYDDRGRLLSLVLSSAQMATDLARFGITPRKSLTLAWPDCLPPAFEAPFLLGYFDGDGCLRLVRGRTYKGLYPHWELAGTASFLSSAITIIHRHLGTDAHLMGPRTGVRGRSLLIRAYGSHARRIDAWLHESGLGLARKTLKERERVLPPALSEVPI